MFSLLLAALLLPQADQPAAVGKAVKPVPLVALDGSPATLNALRGKTATVVVFASFECPVSNHYAAVLNDLARAVGHKGVAVVVVCASDDPREQLAKSAAEFRLIVPVVVDTKKQLARALKAEVTPEAFVLDAAGVVRYRGRIDDQFSARLKRNAVISSHDVRNALDDILAAKPVRTPVTKAVGCPVDYDVEVKFGDTTYHKHVAPILNAHCVTCHRPGEVGPFALTTYKQAKRWAADIVEYTKTRQMPPWMPAAGVPMKGERRLTDAELKTLALWEHAGGPEGDPKDAPPAPTFAGGWARGTPDLIVSPADDFTLAAHGDDTFRCFVLPTGLTEHKWLVGYDVKPGNPRVVHHTLHFFDTTGQGRVLEKVNRQKETVLSPDHGPGYPVAMGVGFTPPPRPTGDVPVFGGLGGWAPGQGPQVVPKGAGWFLPKGADFLLQVHYHRDGKPGTDRTRVGLYFAKEPVTQPWQTVIVAGLKPWDKIPAGKTKHAARGAVYLHTDAVLHNVLPHMHLLGKAVTVTLTPPGGRSVVLVDIPAWDFRWQETYWLREPIAAKAGTKIEIAATFDNSAANPNNPTRPPKDVYVGEQTTDEMLYAFLGATSTKTPHEVVRFRPTPPGAAEADAIEGELTPVLERRLGTWDTRTVVSPSLTVPKEVKIDGSETVERVQGGRFLRGSAKTVGDNGELTTLVTYDRAAKTYRLWLHDTLGLSFDATGTWDEKAQAITWTGSPADGVKGVSHWKFVGADVLEWDFVVTTPAGKLLDMRGTMTRKK